MVYTEHNCCNDRAIVVAARLLAREIAGAIAAGQSPTLVAAASVCTALVEGWKVGRDHALEPSQN